MHMYSVHKRRLSHIVHLNVLWRHRRTKGSPKTSLHSGMTNHAKYRRGAPDQGDIRSRSNTDSVLHCVSEGMPKILHAQTQICWSSSCFQSTKTLSKPFCHKNPFSHSTSGLKVCLPSWNAHEPNESKAGTQYKKSLKKIHVNLSYKLNLLK